MKLYWGDLHNHCGITYGYGSLENAILRAKEHLDFAAFTGHAMWPDIYQRSEETKFIVDFHNQGFQKLVDHWEDIRKTIANANSDDFVSFQGYEIHSSEYGDHHLISPDDTLPLIHRQSPAELVKDCGVKAIAIPHHIGYSPGYRGIDWDKYSESISPLVEVVSKHGLAMEETSPFVYYHDMGPRDSHNTVFEGLRKGHRFGFVGSTDHHAGYPGSYGDGKLAVWAEKKDRDSIWEAFKNRRTYAVTGDKIQCQFFVNDSPMGSVVENASQRTIRFGVTGGYWLDRVIVYKNLKPFYILDGMTLPQAPSQRYKIRIETGWGDNTDQLYRWNAELSVKDGTLVDAERCFRGASILSPTAVKNRVSDEVNGMDNHLTWDNASAQWQVHTVKNQTTLHPNTSAVIFEVEGDDTTSFALTLNGKHHTFTLGEVARAGFTGHVKPYHSQAYKVHTAVPESQYKVQHTLEDHATGAHDFYHMEVRQQNGHLAFVSPVYFG